MLGDGINDVPVLAALVSFVALLGATVVLWDLVVAPAYTYGAALPPSRANPAA